MMLNRVRFAIGVLPVAAAAMFTAWIVSVAAGQCQYEVTVIQKPGTDEATIGLALNNHGHVVGRYTSAVGDSSQAFLWTPDTGYTTLPSPPGASDSYASDINDAGVIVGTGSPSLDESFGWVYADGEYTILPPMEGGTSAGASGINEAGEVAGSRSIVEGPSPTNAFYWSEATGIIDLGVMGDYTTTGADINHSGHLAGTRGIWASTDEAFIWNDGEVTFLGPIPGGSTSSAGAINNRSEVAGAGMLDRDVPSDNIFRAFLWRDGTMILLGTLPYHVKSTARGRNDLTQVVGDGRPLSSSERRAFLWQHGVMHDLNDLIPPRAVDTIERTWDINNSGQIIADGISFSGAEVSFLLTPVNRPKGDADCDCAVGVLDLLFVLAEWGKTDSLADLNGDDVVDVLDLLTVLDDWTGPIDS